MSDVHPLLRPENLEKLKKLGERDLKLLIWMQKWRLTRRAKQAPPDGSWSEWGILSGRGFGKTLTGAHWICEAALADPNPKAHPSHVIAPTLNDIRYTCFEGPTGILSILPPEFIADVNKTNNIITLDNGAVIRGFSAEEPERLRGPQCARAWCFIAGTKVATPYGDRAIEALRPGDWVLTRNGPRRVLANSERQADVGQISFENGEILVGTADHPIYLESGWTRMDQLQIGDVGCAIGASNGAEKRGTSTATARRPTTSERIRSSVLKLAAFTAKNGSHSTGRSQKATTSTTRITTSSTTTPKTWNASLVESINAITSWTNPYSSQSWKTDPFSRSLATCVANPRSVERKAIGEWFANPAASNRPKSAGSSNGPAHTAGQLSEPALELCAVSVASTWRPLGRQSVFCLKVDETPEYFANGVLVHNCDELAAWTMGPETWDQLQFGLRLGPNPQVLWTTTPKPKDLIRKLVEPKTNRVIITGTTFENRANLPDSFFEQLKQYDGTQIGRQELNGELIDSEEGAIIARKWMKLWPSSKPLPSFQWLLCSVDTAFTERTMDKKTQTADPTGCIVLGVFYHDDIPAVMLLDCWDDHLGFPDLVKRMKKEMKTAYGDTEDSPMLTPLIGPRRLEGAGRKPDLLIIEDKGSGISLRQQLAREGQDSYAYNPGRADKTARLHMVSHIFARGQFWIPESEHPQRKGKPKSWVEPFLAQLCSFSGTGSIKHDEYVDCVSQGLRVIIDKGLLAEIKRDKQKERDDYADEQRPRVRSNPYDQ